MNLEGISPFWQKHILHIYLYKWYSFYFTFEMIIVRNNLSTWIWFVVYTVTKFQPVKPAMIQFSVKYMWTLYFIIDLSCSCLYKSFCMVYIIMRNNHQPFSVCGVAYKDILLDLQNEFWKRWKRKDWILGKAYSFSLQDWYLKMFGLAHIIISDYFTGWISAIIHIGESHKLQLHCIRMTVSLHMYEDHYFNVCE